MIATVDDIEVHIGQSPGFTYSLYDHIDIGKVQGDRSTSIDIEATNMARVALGSENMQEQPASRSKVLRIGEQGATYWKGDVRVEEWDRDTIKCTSVGGNGAWINPIKEKRLQDVDFGESDAIGYDMIVATWTDTDSPLYFPLIDYGSFEDRLSSFDVGLTKLRPGVRLYRFLQRAFQEAGFTLKAVGRFAEVFPKLVCPAVSDVVGASQGTLDRNKASFFQSTGSITINNAVDIVSQFPLTDTILDDPSGNASAGDIYTAPFNMTIRVNVSGIVTPNGGNPQRGYWAIANAATNNIIQPLGTNYPMGTGFGTPNNLPATFDETDAIAQVTVAAGTTIRLVWFFAGSGTPDVTFENLVVTFTPVSIPYAEGVQVDIADAAPDMTVADAFKAIAAIFNLAVVTNDRTGTVEVSYFDDFLLPTSQGVDWSLKVNHEEAPKKIEPPIPTSYRFRYEEDTADALLVELDEVAEYPGYGNGDFILSNGYDKPFDVDVKFAPSAMGEVFGTCFIPILHKENGTYQQDTYSFKPRILIADGMADGAWKFDAVVQTEYPNAYFVKPGEPYSLAFGSDQTYGQAAPGTVERYYRNRMQRINDSFVLDVSVRLWDDELQGLDFRKPVLLSDGYTAGWYYVLTVDQKRFGVDEYTRVELLQA